MQQFTILDVFARSDGENGLEARLKLFNRTHRCYASSWPPRHVFARYVIPAMSQELLIANEVPHLLKMDSPHLQLEVFPTWRTLLCFHTSQVSRGCKRRII